MLSSFEKLIFALGLLMFISNSTAKSKTYNVELESFKTLDLCQEEFENSIIVAPSMGQVLRRDSLIGYEILIKYDPTKVVLSESYTTNTIAQFCKYVDVGYDSQLGEVVIDCLQDFFDPSPIQSNLPLIALGGRFIGDCDDTTEITIEYVVPTDDFVGTIDSLKSLEIIGQIIEKPNRKLAYNVLSNNIKIKKDSSINVTIDLDLGIISSLENLTTKIHLDQDSLYIDSIVGNSSIEVFNFQKVDDRNYEVDFRVNDTDMSSFDIAFSTDKFDTNEVNIEISTFDYTKCSCLTNFPNSSFVINTLQSEEDTTINNVEIYDNEFSINGNKIIPLANKTEIEVFNYDGKLIEKVNRNINQVYSTESLDRGIYLIKVTNKNVTKIFKIINN